MEDQSRHCICSIEFPDQVSGDPAWIGVYTCGCAILVALSLKSDGDIEVSLNQKTCAELSRSLDVAARNLECQS